MSNKKIPKCSKCGKTKTLIGCGGGKLIYRCDDCVRESIRKIWEEGK